MTHSIGKRKWHMKNTVPHDPVLKRINQWFPPNCGFYAEFRTWLKAASYGYSTVTASMVSARMIFGMIDKAYWLIDPDVDLPPVRAYIIQRFTSLGTRASYLKGVAKFEEYLRFRNHRPLHQHEPNWSHYLAGLPDWLAQAVKEHLAHQRRSWRMEEVYAQSTNALSRLTRILRWMAPHATLNDFSDLTHTLWFAYVDARLAAGIQAATLNNELNCLQSFVRFFAEEGHTVCGRFLEVEPLKMDTPLPRDVAIDQLQLLICEIDKDATSPHATTRRMGLMDRAWFLLMLHSGLRTAEVRRLRLTDLDLARRQVRIEQSKGLKDRMVYLSPATIQVLEAYLEVRGPAGIDADYVFLYHHQPLSRRYFQQRMRTFGKRCGVKATPHQLRHSCATLLLNAGAPVLTVQTILGHQHVDTTLGYARLYDGTVAVDYYRAMAHIENRFTQDDAPMTAPSTGELLALVDALRNGTLSETQREMLNALRTGLLQQAQQEEGQG